MDTVWVFLFWGLGLITKGPVAVLLSAFALIGLRWKNPEVRLRKLCWGRGVLVMLAVALPWFVAVTWGQPGLWGYFLGRETVGRVLTDVHGRGEAWWYFLPVMAGGILPWTPLLFLTWQMRRNWSPPERRLVRMCLVWAGAGLLLFTLSRSKLPTYALPLMVPLSLLLALTVSRLPAALARGLFRTSSWLCLVVSLVILFGVALALLIVAPREYELPWLWAGVPLALVVALGSIVLAALWRGQFLRATGGLALTALGLVCSTITLVPKVEPYLHGKTPLKYIARRINEADPQQAASVVMFGKLRYGLPFYLQRTVICFQPVAGDQMSGLAYGTVQENSIHSEQGIRELLAGSNRVLCVTDSRQADAIAGSFGLRVLATEGRYALLEPVPSRAGPAGSTQPDLVLPGENKP